MVCRFMMKWGDARNEGYHLEAPLTSEEIRATKRVNTQNKH